MSSNTFCQCCFSKCSSSQSQEENTSDSDNHQELLQVHYEMLQYCFNITLRIDDIIDNKALYICNVCIEQLQQSTIFKNQVQETQYRIAMKVPGSIKAETECVAFEFDTSMNKFDSSSKSDSDTDIPNKESEPSDVSNTVSLETTLNSLINSTLNPKSSNRTKKKETKSDASSTFKCKKCIITFSNKKDYDLHRKLCNNNICPQCGESFENKDIFVSHLKTTHKEKLPCEICNKLISKYYLKAHVREHNLSNEIVCSHCDKTFNTIIKYNKHIKKTSQPKDKYLCNICHKHISMLHVKKHERMHNKEAYQCTKCPQKFGKYQENLEHMLSEHGIEPQLFSCQFCTKTYMRKSTLRSHIAIVHSNREKVTCSECGKQFHSQFHLDRHFVIHTGEKNFECEICKKTFAHYTTLKKHMGVHSQIRDKVCHICGSAFIHQSNLRTHILTHEKKSANLE